MIMKWKILLAVLISACLPACGGGSGTTDQETQVLRTGGKLTKVNEVKLTEYLRESARPLFSPQQAVGSVSISGASDSSASANSFSSTNLQESGVDEADIIKTDGHFIYSVDKADDGSVALLSSDSPVGPNQQASDSIRIMDTTTEVISEVRKIIPADASVWRFKGMYLDQSNAQLIAISSDNPYYPWHWFESAYFVSQTTELVFVDVRDPVEAEVKKTLSFDGNLVDSRRNGDTLYLVLRSYPNIQPDTAISSANDLLPRYSTNQSSKQALVTASDCYIEEESAQGADIITLVAVDLSSSEINSQCFVGPTEALYASNNALYLSTTVWPYQVSQNGAEYDPNTTTNIHKFSYDGLGFDYRGSAEVQGHLGYQQDRKSFRFSEKDGFLRVITFDEQQWLLNNIGIAVTTATEDTPETEEAEPKSPVSLTILAEDPDTLALKQVAKLPNESRPASIGLEGEKLYASRFIGDKAYLVTFRVVDPLYVLDLTNPEDPFIAGELKIEGYSDYLHPVGENLLLGIGKDAIPDVGMDGDSRGAWEQGVKLSLIDVADPANPREADKLSIGQRGTETPALYNHHAIQSVLIDNNLRVTLPINRNEGGAQSTQPWSYHRYQDTGLYKFDIDINNQTLTLEALASPLAKTALNANNKHHH